jgi:cell division protein FtsQ
VTSKSYTNRTTLWDDQDPDSPSAPQARGAWRAPSAVLSGDRATRRAVSAVPAVSRQEDEPDDRAPVPRRAVSAVPAVSRQEDEPDDRAPVPRRAKFAPARTPWWRPRTSFGRILLGGATFIVLAGLVTAGIVVRRFLEHDPHFRIPGATSIQSTGLSEVNRTEVLPVFGEDIGRNIFFVPLSERRKQLEAIPWVQRATVMRYLPDRLSVSIVERTPVAFVREGDRVELADADGVILSMPPAMMAQHHYSFPVITGINARDSLASRRARMAVYQRFLSELDQNNQHLTQQVSEIDLSDPEDLRATMPEQGSDILAHFGEDQFLHRLQIYKSHIAEWRQRYPKLIGVDLRYEGDVPLEMSNDNASAAPATIPTITAKISPKPTSVAKPAALTPIAPPKPVQASTAKPAPSASATKTPAKADTVARKAAEARKRAARLKAAKAAREKAAMHKTQSHPTPAATKQAPPTS